MLTTPPIEQLRHFSLPEYGSIEIDLEPVTAADLHADGHVSVAPSPIAGKYTIKAKHKVGVLRYNDVELRVLPKVSVSRLLYLASNIDDSRSWQELDTMLSIVDDPLSAAAHAFAFHADYALRPTPLQGYVTHETSDRTIRGRVLFGQQSRRAGIDLPIDLRFDDYEVNITENRVLKAALGIVEPHVVEPTIARRLAHLRFRLDGVEPWPAGLELPSFNFTRINDRYQNALAVARLILEQRSLEFPERTQRGTGFLFNMNHVFERYVERKLRETLASFGGRVDSQRSIYLDEAETLLMKPDISWWSGDRCLAVVDAKYKLTRSDDYPNADAYQMLAYCTRLGLKRGVLVYADLDGQPTASAIIRNAGVEVVTTALTINGSIEELQASAMKLGRLVGKLPWRQIHR